MIKKLLFKQLDVSEMRMQLYHSKSPGFVIFKNFVQPEILNRIRDFWLSDSIESQFAPFVANKDVLSGCPNYFYRKPTELDSAFCCFLWNEPPCDLTHELAFEVQQIRNILEGNTLFHGLNGIGGHNLQYRVCNSVSSGQIVYPHGDFVEQERKDPTGSHEFDPSRLQATLYLSSKEQDYDGSGFLFTTNDGKEICFTDLGVEAGDLVIWRYGNTHQVEGIHCQNKQTGFLRIIFPTFDFSPDKQKRMYGNDEKLRFVGEVKGRKIFQSGE